MYQRFYQHGIIIIGQNWFLSCLCPRFWLVLSKVVPELHSCDWITQPKLNIHTLNVPNKATRTVDQVTDKFSI